MDSSTQGTPLTSEQVRQIVREEMDGALTRALDPIIADIHNLRQEIHTVDERRRAAVEAEIARREAMQTELASVDSRAKANEAGITEIKVSVQRLTDMQVESLTQIRDGIKSNHQIIGELKAMQDIDRQRVETVSKRVDDVDRDAGAARQVAESALAESRSTHVDVVDSHRRFTEVAHDVKELKPLIAEVNGLTGYVTILKQREEARAKLRANVASVFKSRPGMAAVLLAGGTSLGIGINEIIHILTLWLGG